MKASDDSPKRRANAAAELAAKKMHVPPRIEAERQGAKGQGECCFDAFAQMVNFMKDGKEQKITHVETRTAAVQGMLDPGNKWLESFRDKLKPDGSGDKLETGLYADYIERMKKPGAWGSVLELAVLARKYRANIVLYMEGRTHPEFIPGSSQATRRAKFLTDVMGFQEKHFFWYKFDWITGAEQGEGPGSVEFANFNYVRRAGVIERAGWNRTGFVVREKPSLEEMGFRVTDGHIYTRSPRLRCAAAYGSRGLEIGNLETRAAGVGCLPEGRAMVEALCNRQSAFGNPFRLPRRTGAGGGRDADGGDRMRDQVCEAYEDFLKDVLDEEADGDLVTAAVKAARKRDRSESLVGGEWTRRFGCLIAVKSSERRSSR